MASPHHRHQSSLEGILNFSAHPTPPLGTELRDYASGRFYDICQHFDTGLRKGDYSRPRLIRYTYEYSLSQESGDHFLRFFFKAVDLPIDGDEPIRFEDVRSNFFNFAEHLFDNFFLPMKASTKKTPQPSPALHSAALEAQGGQQYIGTGSRLSVLRRDCLIRDRHRCVISRVFDLAEADERFDTPGGARDDDGNLLADELDDPAYLEVAHILPHSFTQVNREGKLDPSKESALAILNMFDVGVVDLIQGPEIDRPRNAITLTPQHHLSFGSFKVYFERVPNADHTYTIKTFHKQNYVRRAPFPVIRELYLTPERTIEPPSGRLLAIHCAIAHILHLSGAGEYIDKIYRDLEEHGVQADGSTPLGRFVSLAISPVCT
ncbi:hypothetical protein NUW58_g8424 [Xylaria curta]|uniref:Uncharacterized protein n=1 Tax=Xylaria curta TaxID=42375 RepID=A0ACC1N9S2_9PEZI|nr:hypothetical protein NUW58_g8424 [Xylaria curta]